MRILMNDSHVAAYDTITTIVHDALRSTTLVIEALKIQNIIDLRTYYHELYNTTQFTTSYQDNIKHFHTIFVSLQIIFCCFDC